MLRAIQKGDVFAWEGLLRRAIGPVPKEVVVSEVQPTLIKRRLTGEVIELGMEKVTDDDD